MHNATVIPPYRSEPSNCLIVHLKCLVLHLIPACLCHPHVHSYPMRTHILTHTPHTHPTHTGLRGSGGGHHDHPLDQAPIPAVGLQINHQEPGRRWYVYTHCYVMLFESVPCHAVLCYAVLCCGVLYCAVLCRAVLCCTVLCCAMSCCAVLCDTVFCNTASHSPAHHSLLLPTTSSPPVFHFISLHLTFISPVACLPFCQPSIPNHPPRFCSFE
jgi:hypothetical protein